MTAESDARRIDESARFTIRRIARRDGRITEYRPVVRLRVDPVHAARYRDTWGGSISDERMTNGQPRETALWEITGKPLTAMLREIMPVIRRQREVAETLLAMREAIESAPHTARGETLPADHVATLDALYERARHLNDQQQLQQS